MFLLYIYIYYILGLYRFVSIRKMLKKYRYFLSLCESTNSKCDFVLKTSFKRSFKRFLVYKNKSKLKKI